ncbi:hypothetical protein [Flavonifractor porci]|uniref:hypothetical protein n=1 Tax=Flavonifractor porci TaxID=3133422 RepID=UPI0030A6C694
MAAIRGLHCGSPVIIWGSWQQCAYCGDFGAISSLHSAEKDFLVCDDILPLVIEKLKRDDRLARQLLQNACMDRPQEVILNAYSRLGEKELQQKLLLQFDLCKF